MPFHSVGAQTVCEHDVVDVVVRPLDAIVKSLERTGRLLEGNDGNPGHSIHRCAVVAAHEGMEAERLQYFLVLTDCRTIGNAGVIRQKEYRK